MAGEPEAVEALEAVEAVEVAAALPASVVPEVSARAIFVGSGPRFARDGFGPVLIFFVFWKLAGVLAGVAAATVFSLLAYRSERRQGRQGLLARLVLAGIVLQAVIGVIANDAKVYLAQAVLINGLWGLGFLGSALIGRPLIGAFAGEMYDFPPEVRASRTFRRVFSIESGVWGAFMLARAGVRMATLATTSVEGFLIVNFATGFPLMAGLLSWSVWWAVRSFRRSEEWGWALA